MDISTAILKGLGYTLIHSIWQATLIALAMSIVISLIPRSNAKVRYLTAITALIGVFLTSVLTFGRNYHPLPKVDINTDASLWKVIVTEGTTEGGQLQLIDQINIFLQANMEWIILAWTVGMLFFLLKIVLGLSAQHQLKVRSEKITDHWISHTLRTLSSKIGILKDIELRTTTILTSPAVSGWLKPIIYLPFTVFNQLSPKEAEAILAHELAHIIRHDYLVNLFQSFIEAFYYFHPAVWWISANIRNEREHACDDLAVSILGDKLGYAKSLVALQECEKNLSGGLLMNLASRETPLFDRIKRILNQPKNRQDMRQKIFASLILISSIIWISATKADQDKIVKTNDDQVEEIIKNEIVKEHISKSSAIKKVNQIDTIPKKEQASKSRIIEIKDGKISRMEIDGKEIPEDEFEKYEKEIEALQSEIPEFDHRGVYVFPGGEDMDIIIDKAMEKSEEALALAEIKFHELEPRLRDMQDQIIIKLDDFNFDQEKFKIYTEKGKFYMDTLKVKFDSLEQYFNSEEFTAKFEEMGEKLGHMFDSLDFDFHFKDFTEVFDSAWVENFHQNFNFDFGDFEMPEFDGDIIYFDHNLESRFIREMKKDGLYKEGSNEIQISSNQLKINGEVQSEEQLEKYKEIYEDVTGTKMMDGSSINLLLDKNDNKDLRIKRL